MVQLLSMTTQSGLAQDHDMQAILVTVEPSVNRYRVEMVPTHTSTDAHQYRRVGSYMSCHRGVVGQ